MFRLLFCIVFITFVSVSSSGKAVVATTQKNGKECLSSKFNFKSWPRGVLTVGTLLDTFNGIGFVFAPAMATKASALPAVPGSVSSILGVTFLSAACGKFTVLTRGSESELVTYCRNMLVPLGVLGSTLVAIPLKAGDPKVDLLLRK